MASKKHSDDLSSGQNNLKLFAVNRLEYVDRVAGIVAVKQREKIHDLITRFYESTEHVYYYRTSTVCFGNYTSALMVNGAWR
jgi:hypothetical protein